MSDLAVRFKDASEETLYKILAALVLMKGKGIKKVKFEERRIEKVSYGNEWDNWFGEVQFFSREAMEIFGNKIRSRRK